MTDTLPIGLTYLSPVGHYGQQNTQTLGGVSHLWQDFFARAMAEQQEEPADTISQSFVQYDQHSGEPVGGARALALMAKLKNKALRYMGTAPESRPLP